MRRSAFDYHPGMVKLIRPLLTWLLLLAIPLQGFASAAMLFCAHPHGAAPAATAGTTMPGHAEHHRHHPGVAAGVADAGDLFPSDSHRAGSHPTDSLPTHAGADTCSACAACCTVAGLLNTGFVRQATPPGSAVIPFLPSRFASHTPPGLDPPPRHTA